MAEDGYSKARFHQFANGIYRSDILLSRRNDVFGRPDPVGLEPRFADQGVGEIWVVQEIGSLEKRLGGQMMPGWDNGHQLVVKQIKRIKLTRLSSPLSLGH